MFKEFFLLCLIAVAQGYPQDSLERRAQTNDFDVVIFTQHWPQTVCVLWTEESTSHTCSLPKNNEWSIHGIWPTQFHKIGPLFCNKSMQFDVNAIRPFESVLREKWIDVEHGREPYSFWKHEWDKHGTCAAVLPQMNTEVKYFKEGLTLLDKYDMKNVLGQANIVPGRNYAAADIFNAVHRVLGKRAVVTCAKSKSNQQSYLLEIRICFNKAMNLIDCDNVSGYPTNCNSGNVVYPGAVYQNYEAVQV